MALASFMALVEDTLMQNIWMALPSETIKRYFLCLIITLVMVKENCDVEISQPAKHVACFLTGTKHDHMSNYKSKLLFNLTPAIREKEGSPQCGHEGFFLLLQKLVLLLQMADLGIFQQTL